MQTEKQRERLAELIKKVPYGVSVGAKFEQHFCEKMADHLIANNVVVLPCKVGDTVYQPSYKFTKCSPNDYEPKYCDDSFCCGCEAECDSVQKPYVYEGEVVSVRVTRGQIFLAVSFKEKFDSSSFILGKTVFLSREEAENVLKERKENGK